MHYVFFRNNIGRCGNEFGPLTDLPDWSYAGKISSILATWVLKLLEKNTIKNPLHSFAPKIIQEVFTNTFLFQTDAQLHLIQDRRKN